MAELLGQLSILFFIGSIAFLAEDWQVALMLFGLFIVLLGSAVWLESI
jgi:hypothetical protein